MYFIDLFTVYKFVDLELTFLITMEKILTASLYHGVLLYFSFLRNSLLLKVGFWEEVFDFVRLNSNLARGRCIINLAKYTTYCLFDIEINFDLID